MAFGRVAKPEATENRIEDQYSFQRGGGAGPNALENTDTDLSGRGGFGHPGQTGVPGAHEGGADMVSSQLASNPHSIHGFRRAIMHSQGPGTSSRLINKVRNSHDKRMNRVFQGSKTHGMHVGGMGIHGSGGLQG